MTDDYPFAGHRIPGGIEGYEPPSSEDTRADDSTVLDENTELGEILTGSRW